MAQIVMSHRGVAEIERELRHSDILYWDRFAEEFGIDLAELDNGFEGVADRIFAGREPT